MKIAVYYLLFLISYTQAKDLTGVQPWTRAHDNKTISASFISFDDEINIITLKLKNGKTVKVDAAILTPEHRSRLESLHKKAALNTETRSKPTMETITPKLGGPKIHIYKSALYIDAEDDQKFNPILFLYSPSGGALRIVHRLKPTADKLGWVLVGVDAYSNAKAKKNRSEVMENTKIAYNWAKKNLTFDSKKIVFGGFSGGAWWSYQSASELTKKAAGILAFGGWMSNMYSQNYSRKMAVALVTGDKDKGALTYEEPDTNFLKKSTHSEVKVFHFPGAHVLAPSEKALEAARWIHTTKEF